MYVQETPEPIEMPFDGWLTRMSPWNYVGSRLDEFIQKSKK